MKVKILIEFDVATDNEDMARTAAAKAALRVLGWAPDYFHGLFDRGEGRHPTDESTVRVAGNDVVVRIGPERLTGVLNGPITCTNGFKWEVVGWVAEKIAAQLLGTEIGKAHTAVEPRKYRRIETVGRRQPKLAIWHGKQDDRHTWAFIQERSSGCSGLN